MSDDIAERLRTEVAKAEVAGVLPHWELAKCMWEAADEIERLRSTIVGWSQDISNLKDENQQLREQIEDCENDFHALKQMFDNMRDLSYKWQNIANDLYYMLETGSSRQECDAMDKWEQAITNE